MMFSVFSVLRKKKESHKNENNRLCCSTFFLIEDIFASPRKMPLMGRRGRAVGDSRTLTQTQIQALGGLHSSVRYMFSWKRLSRCWKRKSFPRSSTNFLSYSHNCTLMERESHVCCQSFALLVFIEFIDHKNAHRLVCSL